jgi:F0F1-type ATP synthase membrane subunit b/b'
MSKDTLDKAADTIKRTVDDAKDVLHEAHHRSAAETERARREALDGDMTAGEKAGSVVNEAKHRAQAEIDKAKREVREHGR